MMDLALQNSKRSAINWLGQRCFAQDGVFRRAVRIVITFSAVAVSCVGVHADSNGGHAKTAPIDSALAAVQSLDPVTPVEALRRGAKAYYAGNKAEALRPLQYAADNGQAMAAWKLGRMYAYGDGVAEDDLKAFHYYSRVAREHSGDSPRSSSAPFVANALVELGNYYLTGIEGSPVQPNRARALEIFTYCASYFGDADAQYHLGLYYLQQSKLNEGQAGERNRRLAARWLKLSAVKGHIFAQAKFGELLYNSDSYQTVKNMGIRWITLAQKQITADLQRRLPHNKKQFEEIAALHEKVWAEVGEQERRDAVDWASAWLARHASTQTAQN